MTATEWLTLVLVLITTFYALVTFKILRANEAGVKTMHEQHAAEMRPYVLVTTFVRTGTPLIYLLIKNVGKTAASSLNLSLDRDFWYEGKNIAKRAAFTDQIDSLPPNAELLFLLGEWHKIYDNSNNKEPSPLLFTVTATYSTGVTVVTEKSIVDLRPYIDTAIPHDPVAEELDRLRKSIEKLLRGHSMQQQVSKSGERGAEPLDK